jgi:hypothetical protein
LTYHSSLQPSLSGTGVRGSQRVVVQALLTESASLTAREILTVLNRDGLSVVLPDSGGLTLSRFTQRRGELIKATAATASQAGGARAALPTAPSTSRTPRNAAPDVEHVVSGAVVDDLGELIDHKRD